MDQAQIDKLRAAGFSDDEIRDYMSNQQAATTQAPVQTTPTGEVELDPNAPSETLTRAQAAGVPTGGRESSFISDVGTLAAAKSGQFIVENPLLSAAAAAYGASYVPGVNRLPVISDIRNTRTAVSDIAQRAMNKIPPPPTVSGSPITVSAGAAPASGTGVKIPVTAAPSTPVAPSAILDASGRPMAATSGPVAPQVTQAARPMPTAQPASMLDKTTAMIRQLAANKVLQGAARVGGGVAAALTPGNIGQNYMVPEAGRMRGMEINPLTGRPWTKEQLDMYAQNPAAFDAQLGAPQMPR
jgi:hypothetical protein